MFELANSRWEGGQFERSPPRLVSDHGRSFYIGGCSRLLAAQPALKIFD